jgi:DNA repair exonuclease SbcCD ATPase subunit
MVQSDRRKERHFFREEVATMNTTLLRGGAVLVGAVAIALPLVWTSSVQARPDDPTEPPGWADLVRRVQAIEQTLALPERNPTRPAIEQRLRILEEGLRGLTRASGQPSGPYPSDNVRHLQESIKDSRRQYDELTQRVARLEATSTERGRAAPAATLDDYREVRKTAELAQRETESLNRRVQQLERDVSGRSTPAPSSVSADLKGRLDTLQRAVEALKNRVRQLESRS